MKRRPMVLRLTSGSVTPSSASRKSSCASTCTSGMLYESRNSVTTCSASPRRRRPWSTKTQVSWSPIASWISTADGRIDPAGQAADDAAAPDLRADALDRLVLEGAHGPVAGQAGDLAHEVAQECRSVRRVHHLGVELHGIEPPSLVGHGGKGGAVRHCDGPETVGELGHAVAVAHPDRVLFADVPDAPEQRTVGHHLDLGAAELRVVAAFDLAAELRRHGLLAVAD